MNRIVGVIPAAGRGKRTHFLPCSKEIFPIGFMDVMVEGQVQRRPKAVGSYLLERMVMAGADRILIVSNRDKADILRYFGGGLDWGAQIAYLVQENTWGMPYALDLTYPWLRDETVLFGMPDTIFEPFDAFKQLLAEHRRTSAAITLGLFPTDAPERFGMVAFHEGWMLYTVDKPVQTDLTHMWGIACWEPSFSQFMHEYLGALIPPAHEIVLGDVFQAALEAGLAVQVLPFEDGEYIDIGTPEDLAYAIHRFSR